MNDNPFFIVFFKEIIPILGCIGSIIVAYLAYKASRVSLKFHRKNDSYNDYNKIYTGDIFCFKKSNKVIIYITFTLFNELKKVLIQELECKIFDVQNQKFLDCKIIEDYSKNNFSDDGVAWGVEPPDFPKNYYNLGLINNREIPTESARDYFLALECEGIVFDNPEEQNIDLRQDKFTVITDIELQLNFITSKNKAFCFKTNVFRLDPCLHPNRTEL